MEKNDYLKKISFVLLFISIMINFKEWIYEYKLYGYKIYSENLNIKPSLLSTFISLLLFGGFIFRNINDITNDYIKIIFYITDLIFFSGFISMFSNGQANILGFSSQSILFVSIILMWIGVRSFLRYIILIFIGCSILFISKVNEAMGFFGAIYIICAFISFLIQVITNIFPRVKFDKNDLFGKTIIKRKKRKKKAIINY